MKTVNIETTEEIKDIIDYLNKQSYLRDGATVRVDNCGKIYSYKRVGCKWVKL